VTLACLYTGLFVHHAVMAVHLMLWLLAVSLYLGCLQVSMPCCHSPSPSVIGLRQGIREAEAKQQAASASEAAAPESGKSSEVPVSSAASRGSNVGDS
jgi:hypothetical protein